jgi:Leucine-rich repeat (LRR) protein
VRTTQHPQSSISNTSTLAKWAVQDREFIRKLPTEAKWNLCTPFITQPPSASPPNNYSTSSTIRSRTPPSSTSSAFTCVRSLHKLDWNECEALIKLPGKYTFPHLKVLNLGGNNIESLEPLQNGSFEKLEELWLWHNRIVRVDTLRKCNFPSLRRLDLGENRIMECGKLSEFHCPLLRLVNI